MAVPIQKQLWTIEELERAWDAGAFPPDARLELIRGEIVEMSPIGDPHAFCVMWLCDLLSDLKPKGISSIQGPLKLPELGSVPQPDAVVFRRRDFRTRPPRAEDVLFLVEVSDSSLAYDRDVKMPLYAEVGIREAWLVDLTSDRIFVYRRRPSPEGYQDVRIYSRGDFFTPKAFPGKRFAVDDILGS